MIGSHPLQGCCESCGMEMCAHGVCSYPSCIYVQYCHRCDLDRVTDKVLSYKPKPKPKTKRRTPGTES